MALYLDNAATSFPKPESVYRAVEQTMRTIGASPGRGGYQLAVEASRLVYETRAALADLFAIEDSSRIAFTANATEAINLALFGLLKAGDRVVTSGMEHNAVARPLFALQEMGVEVVQVPADSQGFIDPEDVKKACREKTRLVILNHCSNVTGTLQPIEEIGPWCRKEGILFMVDAAQSAGLFALNVAALAIDLLAVPGHKGLYGPQGTGFLYVHPGLNLKPLLYGGTGNASHSLSQPEAMPEHLESGTVNTPGLAGLKAGVEFIAETGIEAIRTHERTLLQRLMDGLRQVKGVELYGPRDFRYHGGAVSFNLIGRDPAEVGFLLDHEHQICCRVGLHCAPAAHRTIGTFPRGTVRVSPGFFNTVDDIDCFLTAVDAILSRPEA